MRRTIREAWIERVLLSPTLPDSCRRLLLCLAMIEDKRGPWMANGGRVRPVKHSDVASALGIAEGTVANRIVVATRLGYLAKDPRTGNRGRPAAYQATFPSARGGAAEGPVSLRSMVGVTLKVHASGEPSEGQMREPFTRGGGLKVHASGEPLRARDTETSREQPPAPDESREEPAHDGTSTTGNYGRWLPAPSKCPSSVLKVGAA